MGGRSSLSVPFDLAIASFFMLELNFNGISCKFGAEDLNHPNTAVSSDRVRWTGREDWEATTR